MKIRKENESYVEKYGCKDFSCHCSISECIDYEEFLELCGLEECSKVCSKYSCYSCIRSSYCIHCNGGI